MYGAYGIVFDGTGSWSFGNDFTRNVLFFGVDNSSSSHIDNHKNNFIVLGEGPANYTNDSPSAAKQKFSINFTKAKTKFWLRLHYNGYNSYFFANGKKFINLKLIIKM